MKIFARRGRYSAQPKPVPVPVPVVDASLPGIPFIPFQVRDTVSIGSQSFSGGLSRSFGTAQIDCRYRSSNSKWGQCMQGDAARQAGALYFDLVLNQPSDCLLEAAEVHLRFTSDQSTVQVSEWFGPRSLRRELAHDAGSKITQIQPEVSLGVAGQSASVGGVGTTKSTETEQIRRWELWARTVDSGADGLYDTLVWQWQGNASPTDAMPRMPFKSGLVLYHNAAPFVVSLEIRGKVQGGSFVKSKSRQFPRKIIPVLSTEDLGAIAEALHEQMLKENAENRA